MDRATGDWLNTSRLRDTAPMNRTLSSRIGALLAPLVFVAAPMAAGTPVQTPTAISAPTTATLDARIDAIIRQPRFAGAAWGIKVVSLDNGNTLYAYRPDHLLLPASTAKLYTAALTLDTVGADYRIPTRLLGAGPIRQGTLEGPLVLYGMGDPSLGATDATANWADQMARQLAAHDVHRIHGNLIADASYFVGPRIGSGWEAGDLQSSFAAPTSALTVDENTVQATVEPGAHAGWPAHVALDPADTGIALDNTIVTTAAHTPSDINLYRAPNASTLYAFGSVPAGMPAQHFRLSIDDPARFAAEDLRRALAQRGIELEGHVRVLRWPQSDRALLAHAQPLGEVLSPPLIDVLTSGLKRSQNLYLQNLLQIAGVRAQAAAASDPPPPTFMSSEDWGLHALHALLGRIGISPSQALLEEGTGLSRQDLTTPAALVRLLQYLAAQPYAAQLRNALPIAGVDGTLQWRMRDTPAAGNVHAKTGSMTYVDCLAGYVTSADGEHLAFAILLNNYRRPDNAPPAGRDLDAIAELLATLHGRG